MAFAPAAAASAAAAATACTAAPAADASAAAANTLPAAASDAGASTEASLVPGVAPAVCSQALVTVRWLGFRRIWRGTGQGKGLTPLYLRCLTESTR